MADIHHVHGFVMAGFPRVDDAPARRAAGVLYRAEPGARMVDLLVQSLVEPAWPDDRVADVLAEPPRTKLAAAITTVPRDATLRFALVANPSRSIRPEGRTSRHAARVPLRREDAQREWLDRQGARHGFRVVHGETLVRRQPLHRGRRNGTRITVEPYRFDGLLIVTDEERFREALCTGIGPAKAYGCGLLTIARAS